MWKDSEVSYIPTFPQTLHQKLCTLPKFNMEPEKWHPGIGDSFWKPSFSGSMLIFHGVLGFTLTHTARFTDHITSTTLTSESRPRPHVKGNDGRGPDNAILITILAYLKKIYHSHQDSEKTNSKIPRSTPF